MNAGPAGTPQASLMTAEGGLARRSRIPGAGGEIEREFDAALLAAIAGAQSAGIVRLMDQGGGTGNAPAAGKELSPDRSGPAAASPSIDQKATSGPAPEVSPEGSMRLPAGMDKVAASRLALPAIDAVQAPRDADRDAQGPASDSTRDPVRIRQDGQGGAGDASAEAADVARSASGSATTSADAGGDSPGLATSLLRGSLNAGGRASASPPAAASFSATPTAQDLATGVFALKGGAVLAGGGAVVVPFTDEHGLLGSIRLSVRGGALSATIISSDRAAADRLGQRVLELERALSERGFSDPQVSVRFAKPDEASGARPDPRETRDRSRDTEREGGDTSNGDASESERDRGRAGSDRREGGRS